jgi:hypothetical protein
LPYSQVSRKKNEEKKRKRVVEIRYSSMLNDSSTKMFVQGLLELAYNSRSILREAKK